jgi:hypothetical protein
MLFVDTGLAGFGFTAPESTLKAAGVDLSQSAEQSGLGGGGKVKIMPFTLKNLSIEDIHQTDVPSLAGPFPTSLENKYGFQIGGLVSHSFFRSYALTLDFHNMMLRFQQQN